MFCPKCGKQIPDNAAFCPECGASFAAQNSETVEVNNVSQAAPAAEPTPAPQAAPAAEPTPAPAKKEKKKKKGKGAIIAIILIVLAIIIGAFILIAGIITTILLVNNSKTVAVNPENYVSISFYGYDTLGHATASFDESAFVYDYADLKLRKNKFKNYLVENEGMSEDQAKAVVSNLDDGDVAQLLCDYFLEGSLDITDGLSNGDDVTYSFDGSKEDIENCFKVTCDAYDIVESVFGLDEIVFFDPFENVEIYYGGKAPCGTAEIWDGGLQSLYYGSTLTIDISNGLSNGDVVTVTYDIGCTEEEFVEKFDTLPNNYSKTYTVEGLAAWVTDSSEVSEEMLEQFSDDVQNRLATSILENSLIGINETVEYEGFYFGASNEDIDEEWSNVLVMVFKNHLHIDYKDGDDLKTDREKEGDYYLYFVYENVSFDRDGKPVGTYKGLITNHKELVIEKGYFPLKSKSAIYSYSVAAFLTVDEIKTDVELYYDPDDYDFSGFIS